MHVLPKTAQVVIVGGGVIGCSIAYHLAKLGMKDIVLLERKQLTSGTTWHAAGLIGQLRQSINMTQLAKYTAELYRGLESETGQATGYRQCGSVSLACTPDRMEELQRNASMAKVFELRVDVVSPREIKELYPLVNIEDVIGGIHIPTDGYANAVDVTQALSKGARSRGAQIFQDVKVTSILHEGGRATGVQTEAGRIDAQFVVLCTGMWTRDFAAGVGVNVPLQACEHYYVLFKDVAGLNPDMPVLRDYDHCSYFKYDAGRLLVGAFEPHARPWATQGIPEDFSFGEIAGDFSHFEPMLIDALRRVPALENAGIQKFFCGPESFTPDVRYHLGESAELQNCFVAAGLNSIGLQSAGGIGKVMSEWIRDGHPPVDLWEVDVRRNMPFQINRRYLRERATESLGLLYATHWPYRQYESARGVRKSALHDRLRATGACFGEAFGWERPNWYAPHGIEPRYAYSYGRQNWFEHSAAEHRGVRDAVGLFDQSSFAKFRLEGRDAEATLNRICANDIAVAEGRIVYTQWLNERGGIEADVTVTRLSQSAYLIVGGAETETKDWHWLKRHIAAAQCVATNMTSAMGVISIMGPRSRELLQSLSPHDLSAAAFPFATSREIELGLCLVRASRITYVGELGWELYIPSEFMQCVYDELVQAGAAFGLVHAGYHALNSLRIEKAYRHWGHDLTDEDTPDEAGLSFAVKPDKAAGFIGREALLASRARGAPRKRLLQFQLRDPHALLYHNEPIWQGGSIVGNIRSAMYGHTLGASVGLGYVRMAEADGSGRIDPGGFEIEVAGVRHACVASLKPLFDPNNERIRR